jgi:hypothetical protein
MSNSSRLSARTGTTPREWLSTCSQIGEVINNWAGRSDLVVYAGSDAVNNGFAIAGFYRKTAEIEISIPKAFGAYATPKMVGDLRNRSVQFDWAKSVGVLYHEALHAKYSEWKPIESSKEVFQTFQLLDESRIERWGVIDNPNNQIFLRASALGLALEELNSEALANLSGIRASAYVSLLSLARVDSGVLMLSDVRATYQKVLSELGEELFSKLRAIWLEFQKLSSSQTQRGLELAKAWNDLLEEVAPSGAGGEGEESEEGGSMGELLEAMETDDSNSESEITKEAYNQQTKEEMKQEAKSRSAKAEKQNKAKEEAKKVFAHNSGGQGASRSELNEKRSPTPTERASAVRLAQMLEKAKYRERSVTEVKSVTPQGRLKTRVAIQNSALESKGVKSKLPAWRSKKRKHTDDPTLTIGVMVDISGSMSSAMESLATTAWVLSEAGRRVQARTAMVYYGQDVFPTLKVGQRLDQVSVYTAPDHTEKFGRAYNALVGELDLLYTSGVKMLVVVSDGQYTHEEQKNAETAIEECKNNGVAVLWITPADCGRSNGHYLVKNNGVVLEGLEMSQTAQAIGKSATEALAKSAVM